MDSIFNQLGYLSPGFHNWTHSEINDRLVIAFPESSTRSAIFQGYSNLCEDMLGLCHQIEQWVNGSFATKKLDPNDIDLVSIFPKEIVDSFDDTQQTLFATLVSGAKTKDNYRCDSYFVPLVDEDDPNWPKIKELLDYWEKWWGEDRNGLPKGKIRVHLESSNAQ